MWDGETRALLQCGHDFRRSRLRLPGREPEIPRAKVQHGVGEECSGVRVPGKTLPDRPHRIGIRDVERFPVLRPGPGVSGSERANEGLLEGRCPGRQLPRFSDVLPRKTGGGAVHERVIDVRSGGDRLPPVRHRASGINRGRLLERCYRGVVIETVVQNEALVEVLLRLWRVGRDLPMHDGEIRPERRYAIGGRTLAARSDDEEEKNEGSDANRMECAYEHDAPEGRVSLRGRANTVGGDRGFPQKTCPAEAHCVRSPTEADGWKPQSGSDRWMHAWHFLPDTGNVLGKNR